MSHDPSAFSLLNLVESVDEIMTRVAVHRVGRWGMSPLNRGIMFRIEALLKHASAEFAKVMNDCRPVNRIPPEILTRIFSFAGRGGPVVKASRVCRWWREIALSSSTLWTVYDTEYFRRMDLALPRSKQALLDVKIRSLDLVNMREYSALRFQAHRLRILDINIDCLGLSDYPSVAVFLAELLPSTALHLTRLSLSTRATKWKDIWEVRQPPEGINSSWFAPLFGGDMPRLKILHLDRIPIWPQFSTATGLQTLLLINSTVSVPTLLSVLQGMPNLEELLMFSLTFVDAFTSPGDNSLPQMNDISFGCTVKMERLRMLHIHVCIKTDAQSASLHRFLSSLSTQDGAAACLAISDDRRETMFPQEIASEETYFVINGMHTLKMGRPTFAYNDRSFVALQSPMIAPTGILFDNIHCVLTHVTTLSWQPFDDISVGELSMLLNSMPMLESLEYYQGSDAADSLLLDVLLEAEPITHIPRYALCLTKMTVAFWGRLEAASSEAHRLMKLLSSRSISGYPIKQIIVEAGNVAEECIQEMKTYVQDVLVCKWPLAFSTKIPDRWAMKPARIYSEHFEFQLEAHETSYRVFSLRDTY